MIRKGVTLLVVILAAMAMAAAVDAAERRRNMHCMMECYPECMQIRVFNDFECKKECKLACAKFAIRKIMRESDDSKLFPLWI